MGTMITIPKKASPAKTETPDYFGATDAVAIKQVRTAETRIKAGLASEAKSSRQIGLALIEAKAVLPHGKFKAWAVELFGMQPRTAQRYMHNAELIKENPDFEKLPPQALHLVSAPTCPASAKATVLDAIAKGDVPNAQEVAKAIAGVKAPKVVHEHQSPPGYYKLVKLMQSMEDMGLVLEAMSEAFPGYDFEASEKPTLGKAA